MKCHAASPFVHDFEHFNCSRCNSRLFIDSGFDIHLDREAVFKLSWWPFRYNWVAYVNCPHCCARIYLTPEQTANIKPWFLENKKVDYLHEEDR